MYAGLRVRIQAFALDNPFIAGYLALLIGHGLIFNFLSLTTVEVLVVKTNASAGTCVIGNSETLDHAMVMG